MKSTFHAFVSPHSGRLEIEMKAGTTGARYGNWVSDSLLRKAFFCLALFSVLDLVLWVIVSGWAVLKVLLAALAVFFLVCTIYFFIAKRYFSYDGGRVQEKILGLLIAAVDWNGEGQALDIGCGSGALTIGIAKKYGNARATGVDFWGGSWDYSMQKCEANARAEGVASRTTFAKASASRLPFEEETFDLVVSNLTFHEVRDCKDKRDAVKEALRVLKKGGVFAFQDLFLIRAYYGGMDAFIQSLKSEGIADAQFIDTSTAPFIPRLLKLPFMVGTIGILHGIK